MTKIKIEATVNRIIDCLIKINFKAEGHPYSNSVLALSYLGNDKAFARIENNNDLNNAQKAGLCFKLFLTTKEPYFIYKAANLSSDYHFIAWVTGSLIKEDFDPVAVRKKIEHDWDKSIVKDFFNNLEFTAQDLEEDYTIFYDLIPTPRISSFHQIQKSLKPATVVNQVSSGWFDGKIHVNYEDAEVIKDEFHKGHKGKLYGYISQKYKSQKWDNALKNGLVKASTGATGVKIMNNNFFELKIKGHGTDSRLYCEQKLLENKHGGDVAHKRVSLLHKNDLGDYLVIFDNEDNHKGIASKANNTKYLEILDCFTESTYSVNHEFIEQPMAVMGVAVDLLEHMAECY